MLPIRGRTYRPPLPRLAAEERAALRQALLQAKLLDA
jgi:hypothetical protein